MKRIIATLAALVGVLAAVFIAAPPALAIRDTGWQFNSCNVGGWNVYVGIRVIWYAVDNHREVDENTYKQAPGDPTRYDVESSSNSTATLIWFAKAVGYDWANFGQQVHPQQGINYYINKTPSIDPPAGHYWLARTNWFNTNCDVMVFN